MMWYSGLGTERELAASGGGGALNSEGTTRSARATESSRGGRKKYVSSF